MKTRKFSRVLKVLLAAMVIVGIMLSFAAVNAEADSSSATVYGKMPNGYTVAATATFSNKTATGTGKVTNGGPVCIEVETIGYYTEKNILYVSCIAESNSDNNTSVTASATGNYTLTRTYCCADFNTYTSVIAAVEK